MMRISNKLFGFLMYLPALICLAVFILYPLSLLAINSMFKYDLLASESKVFLGFRNYLEIFTEGRFPFALKNSFLYVVIAVPIEFLIGLMMATLLNTGFRGSKAVRTIFLFPLMLAPVVVGLTWRFIFADQYGILNWVLYRLRLLGHPSDIFWLSDKNMALLSCIIADTWLATPFMMLVLLAGLQSMPKEFIEAAKIDGASAVQAFARVTLPILRPVVAVVIIIRLIDAFKTFDIVWMLTQGGPEFASEVVSTNIYRELMRYFNVGLSSAMSLVFLLVLLVISVAFFFRV